MNTLCPNLREQFDDPDQQKSAASLGMWTFIASEVLFFSALFLIYAVYRITYPEEFVKAALKLNIGIGTVNTAILLTSSLFVAIGVSCIQEGKTKRASLALIITWLLGVSFLLFKAYEYYADIKGHLVPTEMVAIKDDGSHIARMFYLIYYIITGIHALHLTIGLAVIAVMILKTYRGAFSKTYYTPVEITGLYWHFVDVVWIFIYPLLYLVGRES